MLPRSAKPASNPPTSILRDDSLSLLTRGYDFGERIWRRARPGARSAPMRLLGDEAALVRGVEGVELFYDETRIARHGAMPAIVQETLFGHGSVHSLDGAAHRHRKATFVEVAYEDAQVERLTPWLEREWQSEREAWLDGGTRSAYDAAVGALGRAIMGWAGLPGTPAAKTRWAARLAQIVDGFGVPYSPEFVAAAVNRLWSDRHSRRLIEAVRAGSLPAKDGTALALWASHRGPDGTLLPARLAGVELQNSIRPMIAAARFVAFAAKELHDRPEWRERIAAETEERGVLVGGELATLFAQEVRRTGLFVPMLPGRALVDIEIGDVKVPAGGRVVLDILGTNTDQQSWAHPNRFAPERFTGVGDYEDVRTFIPQGGADVATGHRCPGEKLVIAGLAGAIAVLSDPRLRVLDSGLDVNRRRLPTKPASGGRVRAASGSGRSCPFH
ncbi:MULTISPECIES: cytochrome P450 [unclassified Microbacterium]|uniref:cytochrome P450 n=1 Tax=unclassified Microbacterium TaxID=2609290 RepID=UPI00109D4CC6|nr:MULTISPECIES: cytochrome P450 [unclassified Microbacterium]